MIAATEELFLEVVRGTPRQHGGDAQPFTGNLRPHVLRQHTFGWVLVVRASGRMDVVIAGVPPVARGIDPADEAEQPLLGAGECDSPRLRHVLRAAGHGELERAVWKVDRVAVGSVDLLLEVEV